MQILESAPQTNLTGNIGNFRWRIVALLFFATIINYIDRNVLSFVMADDGFRREMLCLAANAPLSDADHSAFLAEYGRVDAVFKFAYGLGFILMGWFIDKVGVRKGYAVAIFLWVGSALSHSFATTFGRLRLFRFTLGIGEAGNFPSAIKTVAEWFPIKERSKAVGIFNSGANIGPPDCPSHHRLLPVYYQRAYVKYFNDQSDVEQVATDLISIPEKPDAIFSASDRLITACIAAIKKAGLQVPEDIALVGFTNLRIAEILSPALTSVTQPAYEMGQIATELLIKLIESKKPVDTFETRILDTHLIIRASSVKKNLPHLL